MFNVASASAELVATSLGVAYKKNISIFLFYTTPKGVATGSAKAEATLLKI
jgi:hypothetical protein